MSTMPDGGVGSFSPSPVLPLSRSGRSLRADNAERLAATCRFLAQMTAAEARTLPPQGLGIFLNVPPVRNSRPVRRACTITINLAGILVREALRDQLRAAVRCAQVAALAVQAQREREEYFNHSPVRGRTLPIAVAGLWNAAAWLQGDSFDDPQITRASRTLACSFVSVLRGAMDTARIDTGMDLCLSGCAPVAATRELWRRDREFFLRDGVTLDANGIYDGGPSVKLAYRLEELSERLEFVRAVATAFDDPPALTVEAPLGAEPDAEAWRELLGALAQAGLPCVMLLPGGAGRSLRSLARLVRCHLEAYPLFDQMTGDEVSRK